MSPRNFARQFLRQTGTTPHQWLIHLRLLAAQRRLEKTNESIDEVAGVVGWQTAATLRQHFMRHLRTSPTAYRQRFSTLDSKREREIVLTPYVQETRLLLAHPCLPFRVGVNVRSIIVKKIALNLGLAGLIQKVKLVRPQIRVVAFEIGIVSYMTRSRCRQ